MSAHACLAGRERPKPDMPKPWQQTLAAAAGQPFSIGAPSHTVHPPLEPWRHAPQVVPSASSAPAGASDTPPLAASTASEAGPSAGASAAQSARLSAADSTESTRAGLKWRPVPLWHRWHVRQKKAQKRTLEALKALPALKRMRAARLPNALTSSCRSDAHLRHVDAVIEAASTFVSNARGTKAEKDHTFRLLAYAPSGRNSKRARKQQATAADSFSTKHSEGSQRSIGMQQEEPASSPRAAESKPVPAQQHLSGPPRQIPDTGKRLSFQWGGGFAPDDVQKPKQQGDIPDLIGLMCSASPDGTHSESNLPTLTDAEGVSLHDTDLPTLLPDEGAVITVHKMKVKPYLWVWRAPAHTSLLNTVLKATLRLRVMTAGRDGFMRFAGAAEAEVSSAEGSAQSEGKSAGRAGDAPRKRPLGTAWRDGSYMTIPMTTMYELNPATGQVGPFKSCPLHPSIARPLDGASVSTAWRQQIL